MQRTSNRRIPSIIAILTVVACIGFVVSIHPSANSGVTFASSQTDVDRIQRGLHAQAVTSTVYLPTIANDDRVVPASLFGVQMYGSWPQSETGLSLANEAGVYWMRWHILWSSIEPEDTRPAKYNLDSVDATLRSATDSGLNAIVTIRDNPEWAATYANGPIDKVDISKFVEFVRTLAERYDGDGMYDAPGSPIVKYWEFYNEPDAGNELHAEYGHSYWGHFGADYADMLCAVYPAIKNANPDGQVVLGGLAYERFEEDGGVFVREFLDDVLAAGGGDCFDVMNFHYYPVFAPVWDPYGDGLVGKTNYLRGKLAEYDVTKPFMVTEAGSHSDGDSTPQNQSREVLKLFSQAYASSLDALTWWTWQDPGSYYSANGLVTEELEKKPAFFAYKAAVNHLAHASFDRILTDTELGDENMQGYRFTTDDEMRPLYVLWSDDTTVRPVSLSIPTGSSVRVENMYGEVLTHVTDTRDGNVNGSVTVSVGQDPVYVEVVSQ